MGPRDVATAPVSMMRFVDQLALRDKRVFIRVDFNVPMKDRVITDATRIDAALPTIRHVIEQGGRLVLASHLGRPMGKVNPAFSLEPVRAMLSAHLGLPVRLAPDCIGSETESLAHGLRPGEVLLLENLRFHAEEEKNDGAFSHALARLADVYVNDAFGAAHRAHASTAGMTRLIPERAAGFLLKRECEYLGKVLTSPERPLIAVLGGAKVSDKIKVIRSLLERVDALLIGGAMAYTFLRAQGQPTGRSLVEDEQIGLAKDLLALASERGVDLILPADHVVASEAKPGVTSRIVEVIPDDQIALDVGPATVKRFRAAITGARTIFWNGPLGMFEVPPFDAGTMAIAGAVAESAATSIVGGGDSVAAIMRSGRADAISHISTGGGASLEFLEGAPLPGLAALEG
jgi:phosphoglycerate kinase